MLPALLFAPSGQAGGGLSVLLFQVALIFGIFYFLIIRPQRRQRMQHEKLLAGLQKGDQIVTSGGIVGEVVHLKDNEVTIRSGESKLVVMRANIANVVSRQGAEKSA
jgi:preprotein translocase subunit YajC